MAVSTRPYHHGNLREALLELMYAGKHHSDVLHETADRAFAAPLALVEDRWWTPKPVRRRYWEVVTADGRNLVVYRDLVAGGWFAQR